MAQVKCDSSNQIQILGSPESLKQLFLFSPFEDNLPEMNTEMIHQSAMFYEILVKVFSII